MSTYIIDLISHLTLRKIGLTRIKALSPPMLKTLASRTFPNVIFEILLVIVQSCNPLGLKQEQSLFFLRHF